MLCIIFLDSEDALQFGATFKQSLPSAKSEKEKKTPHQQEQEDKLKKSKEELRRMREIHQSPHEEIALALCGVGLAYEDMGKYSEKLYFYQESLSMYKLLGHKEGSAKLLRNVANSLMDLGRPDESLPLLQECLKLSEELYGADHPETAEVLGSLGRAHNALKNHEEGRKLLLQAVGVKREEDVNFAADLHNLGWALQNLGEKQEAIRYYERSLAIEAKIVWKQTPSKHCDLLDKFG